jgi:8-amino-3,8-dideoxy-alpha-D-manno-octulosonate transaminase
MDKAEEKAVLDVLRKGSVFRFYGPGQPTKVAKLEADACSFYGRKHALAVSSGTGGLVTSMLALGVGPGDEVIIPAFMWVATVGAVVHCNAIPVICEVNDSLSMDAGDLERKIARRTKLIVAVHMAGTPCDMDSIMAVADRHGIDVLEDCAQCNGGSFRGRKVGSFGRIGVFSFQINKNATAGEGGLIVTDDADLYERLNAAHDLGVPWGKDAPDSASGVHLWGQGRRMSELCGAVAGVQLGKLPKIVNHTRASNHRIQDALKGIRGLGFRRLNDPDGDTGPFLVVILPDRRLALKTAENLKAGGVKSVWRIMDYGMHVYYNIAQLVDKTPLSPAGNPWSLPQNAKSVHDYGKGACPVSDDLFGRSVLIAIPSRLTRRQETLMAQALRKAVTAAMG